MQHQAEPQSSTPQQVTLGDLVAIAFDRAEEVSSEPGRVATLATFVVQHNLAWSPHNATMMRKLRVTADEWAANEEREAS